MRQADARYWRQYAIRAENSIHRALKQLYKARISVIMTKKSRRKIHSLHVACNYMVRAQRKIVYDILQRGN